MCSYQVCNKNDVSTCEILKRKKHKFSVLLLLNTTRVVIYNNMNIIYYTISYMDYSLGIG